jgi:hypothetical protein
VRVLVNVGYRRHKRYVSSRRVSKSNEMVWKYYIVALYFGCNSA